MKTMEFYVVSQNLEILGIIDTYKSAIWTERYYTSGNFELYLPATDKMLDLLRKNLFLVRTDDTTKAMVIESIKITTDADDGNYITVTGHSLSSILSRRIVWKQTTYSGYVEKVIRKLVNDHCIEPEITERAINHLYLGDEIGLEDKVKVQYTGDNVETAIQDLCKAYGIGYRISLDLPNQGMTFAIYKGLDRSYNQNVNPYVVFSPNFENLLSSDYANDDSKFKNVAQVAGEGQGTARKKTVVGTGSGLNRFETFVSASGVSSNEGEIDAQTYLNLLAQEGIEKLAELGTFEKMDSEVAPNHTYKLNIDYFLGDIVEVINEYGIAMTPRVTEVIESQSDTGYTCIPTFANDEKEA